MQCTWSLCTWSQLWGSAQFLQKGLQCLQAINEKAHEPRILFLQIWLSIRRQNAERSWTWRYFLQPYFINTGRGDTVTNPRVQGLWGTGSARWSIAHLDTTDESQQSKGSTCSRKLRSVRPAPALRLCVWWPPGEGVLASHPFLGALGSDSPSSDITPQLCRNVCKWKRLRRNAEVTFTSRKWYFNSLDFPFPKLTVIWCYFNNRVAEHTD